MVDVSSGNLVGLKCVKFISPEMPSGKLSVSCILVFFKFQMFGIYSLKKEVSLFIVH